MKKQTLNKAVILSGVLGALVISFAVADLSHADSGGKMGHKQKLGQFDTNADGKISKNEFEAGLKTRFTKIDTDNNGQISKGEFKDRVQQKAKAGKRANRMSRGWFKVTPGDVADAVFTRLDVDKNGNLSFEEFSTDRLGWFTKSDVNKDGVLSGNELPRPKKWHKGEAKKWHKGGAKKWSKDEDDKGGMDKDGDDKGGMDKDDD